MPIKGLSDRGLAFPEIGQIRKGAPKTENAPGKDLAYFRVDFDEQETEAIAKFTEIYGDKPTDINIVLPFNEIEQLWDAWLEGYTAGRLVARSDGEKFIYLVDTKTGDVLVKNGVDKSGKPMPYTDGMIVGYDYQGKPVKCKAAGRLKVVIPELQRLAFLTVLTTSLHDIGNISAQLLAIQTFCVGMGKGLGGTPLVLRRRPHEVSTPDPKDKSKRARRTKWLLSIEADPEFVKAALIETKRLALPGNGLALPAPKEMPAGPEWAGLEEEDEAEELTAEVTELAEEEAPEPEEIKQPAYAPQRPLSSEVLRSFLAKKAATKSGPASPDQLGLMSGMMELPFAPDKDADKIRRSCIRFLWGVDSSKKLTGPQVKATLDWLKPVKDSGGAYSPDPMAATELKSVWTAANIEAGQGSLI